MSMVHPADRLRVTHANGYEFAIPTFNPSDTATWPDYWEGAKWGNTNPVANCAIYYDMPVAVAQAYVDFLIHGNRYWEPPVSFMRYAGASGRQVTKTCEYVSFWQTSRIRPDAMWDDLREIAKRAKPDK